MYALTEIKGVGRRYSNIVCKKADVDLNKRCALELLLPLHLDAQFDSQCRRVELRRA